MVKNKLLLKGAQNSLNEITLVFKDFISDIFLFWSFIRYLYKGRPARFVKEIYSCSTIKACNVNNWCPYWSSFCFLPAPLPFTWKYLLSIKLVLACFPLKILNKEVSRWISSNDSISFTGILRSFLFLFLMEIYLKIYKRKVVIFMYEYNIYISAFRFESWINTNLM